MEYRRMGRTGLRVSTICLGTMTFGFQTDESAAHRIMDIAWDAGVNFLDSSDVYPMGSEDTGTTEAIVGTWLARMPRDRVVVATKARGATGEGPNDVGLSRQHILSAVDASLERLGTDYIDLYQTHFPDPDTPIDETLKALDDPALAQVPTLRCSILPGRGAGRVGDGATGRLDHFARSWRQPVNYPFSG